MINQRIPTETKHSIFKGSGLGDCTTDSFSITAPGNAGTPVICGFNTGQHSKSTSDHNILGWQSKDSSGI